jgi:hypothetical protein
VNYDEVLRELVAALGAALFIGNVLALVRRRSDARRAAQRSLARSRPGSPVRGNQRAAAKPKARNARANEDLPQAPVARTVTYAVIGFVVMVWGIASVFTS